MPGTQMTQPECDRLKRLLDAGHDMEWISQVMGRAETTLRRIVKAGFKAPHKGLPAPADFAEVGRLYGVDKLAKRYGVAHTTILKWIREVIPDRESLRGRKGVTPANRTYAPEGFKEYFLEHGYSRTQRQYQLSGSKMMRWLRDLGLRQAPKPEAAPLPANDAMSPPPGYELVKAKLGRPRDMFGMAA